MTSAILQGDALDVLRTFASDSIQCWVTSPPYWGLRDYGIPGRVWGGDPDHSHEWVARCGSPVRTTPTSAAGTTPTNGRGEAQSIEKRPASARQAVGQGAFCRCGAWFGVLGLEPTPDLYVEHMVEIFSEVYRVLKPDGTLWLNLGDCYATGGGKAISGGGKQGERWAGRGMNTKQPKWAKALGPICQPNRMPIAGLKPKDLVGMPWRVAFALQAAGWYLRSDIIWHKPNPMPESVRDRPTKSHEYIFLLAKSEKYFYDRYAIQEPCSPDTHARYARGRGASHKWADGGPGNQTIGKSLAHMIRDEDKVPAGWHQGTRAEGSAPRDRRAGGDPIRGSGNIARKVGDGTEGRFANHLGRNVPWSPGVNPKAMVNVKGSKQNASFSAVVKDLVPARNKRTVWKVTTRGYKGAHFATYPTALVEPCILAGSRPGDTVLDPFAGSGTTLAVARQHGRRAVGIELNPDYIGLAEQRLAA